MILTVIKLKNVFYIKIFIKNKLKILFEMARFYSPSIIFFDEVDSIGCKRQENDNEVNRKLLF